MTLGKVGPGYVTDLDHPQLSFTINQATRRQDTTSQCKRWISSHTLHNCLYVSTSTYSEYDGGQCLGYEQIHTVVHLCTGLEMCVWLICHHFLRGDFPFFLISLFFCQYSLSCLILHCILPLWHKTVRSCTNLYVYFRLRGITHANFILHLAEGTWDDSGSKNGALLLTSVKYQ